MEITSLDQIALCRKCPRSAILTNFQAVMDRIALDELNCAKIGRKIQCKKIFDEPPFKMKFSIISLMTAISVFSWFLALHNTTTGYRGTFVAISLLVVVGLMFAIATTSPTNKKGIVEPERNDLLQALELAFKTVGIICAITFTTLISILAISLVWLIVSYGLAK